ncbi:hypothetical protein M5689_008040 [Euphorbia peplus]|nr:hypothetical protein M5689_008040 [Euphorbia peplus]
MEITVLSAQGLKSSSSSPFSGRLRPFITITTYPAATPSDGDKNGHMYTTRIDEQGGVNPKWNDKFHVPIEPSFFANRYSSICLELYTKRLIMGKLFLGWCQIPVTDLGFPAPEDAVRFLNYRLRDRDGTRGHGIINLAIKLTGFQPVAGDRLLDSHFRGPPEINCQTVIGIPVASGGSRNFRDVNNIDEKHA